jgi:hypothetical protein
MRILLLYTPRSGTNSLCKYFLKQNPNYEYINQPWAEYQEGEIKFVPYEQCVKHQNVLIKSEISNLDKLNISVEKLHRDFDKIFMMSRKNKKEQSISFIIAANSMSFLNITKKKYFIKGIREESINSLINEFNKNELIFEKYKKNNSIFIYYEELYYEKKFDIIFDFLNLNYIHIDFENILDSKHKYFSGEFDSKTKKTLI